MKTRTALLIAAVPLALAPAAFAQTSASTTGPQASPQTKESIVVQGSFLGAGAQSATKLDATVRDTPFTVESYTASFMKAIETTNVADLYSYMTGVKRAGNTGYDLTIRGFKTGGDDKSAIMVDGLPGLTGRFGSPPTVGVDHVEVVKGPMSVLYGQIQPGGFVNLISKKPMGAWQGSLDIKGTTFGAKSSSLGTARGYDAAVDVTGPFDADGRFLYRAIAEYGDRNSFREFVSERASYLAPSATWNISDATSVTAQVEYRQVYGAYDDGLAVPSRDISRLPPIDRYLQEPGDWRKETGAAGVLQATHAFTDSLTWNGSLRSVYNRADDAAYASLAVRPDGHTLQRRIRNLHAIRHYNYFDTNASAQFETGGIKHKVLFGVGGGRDTDHEWRERFFTGGACPGPTCIDIDIYNPVYGNVPSMFSLPAFSSNSLRRDVFFTSDSLGTYVSDLITLSEHWKLTAGVRNVHDKQKFADRINTNLAPTDKTADKSAVPMAGILFQPSKAWTIYASYAESYVPVDPSLFDATGKNPFIPIEGKQYEAGVKAERLFEGRLTGSLAVFRIDRKNTTSSFTCPLGTCTQQLGSERSRGAELELNVRPVKNWQTVFGYTLLDAKVTASPDAAQVGALLPNVPRRSANLWSRYDIKDGPLKGLGVGVGLVYVGDRAGALVSTADRRDLHLPSYTVADVGFYYLVDRYAYNLKIGNIFDKEYIESAGSIPDIRLLPGAPRNVTLSVRVNF